MTSGWLAMGQNARKIPLFAGERVCETIGNGARAFEEDTRS
jgi:hypothetical protein